MAENSWQKQCNEKRSFWQTHVRAWGKSGLSQREYCRSHQLSSHNLAYWKKKFADEVSQPSKFVAVPVVRQAVNHLDSNKSGVTILVGDFTIKLANSFNPVVLSQAVVALKGES